MKKVTIRKTRKGYFFDSYIVRINNQDTEYHVYKDKHFGGYWLTQGPLPLTGKQFFTCDKMVEMRQYIAEHLA